MLEFTESHTPLEDSLRDIYVLVFMFGLLNPKLVFIGIGPKGEIQLFLCVTVKHVRNIKYNKII